MIDRFNTYLNNTYGYFQGRFKKLIKNYSFFQPNYKKISNMETISTSQVQQRSQICIITQLTSYNSWLFFKF